jgi:formylglycine-generating enzyme required for sulfatase activity
MGRLWQDGGFDRLGRAIEHALTEVTSQRPASEKAEKAIPVAEHQALKFQVSAPTFRLRPQMPITRRKPRPAVRSRPTAPDDLTVFRDADFAPELIVLPQGEFMMGSTRAERQWAIGKAAKPERVDWEAPQHRVKIGYRIAVGRYTVTFEEWDWYVEDSAWHHSRSIKPYRPSDEGWGGGRRPVINVSWDDIQDYVKWLSARTSQHYRLLSEAEWEYACRASTTTAYHVGSGIANHAANFGGQIGKTTEVDLYLSNGWGLYDMHGNVWEWVHDCWNKSYRGAPDDGSAWKRGDCSHRVLRGGCWGKGCSRGDLRAASRRPNRRGARNAYSGFRIASTFQ